jgi:hypothetical protein
MTKPYFDIAPFILREDGEQTWEDERGRGSVRPSSARSPRARLRPRPRPRPRRRPPVRRRWPVPTFTQLAAPCVCPPPGPEPVGGEPIPPDRMDAATPEPAPPDAADGEVFFEIGKFPPAKASFRYVKDFSGPASECVAALKRAGKTRSEALTIINAQIGVAISLLRKSATDLRRGSRSAKTKATFLKIFRVKPEFVPTWFTPTNAIKDRGDVVATRCSRVADLLASGALKFFCTINPANCPDCSNDQNKFACSSWGDESKAPAKSRVVCLGHRFWDDMKAKRTDSLLATLMHEPFHIYFGKYVTSHRADAGKFGGINCILQFVFETNNRVAPARVTKRCTDMAVRGELGGHPS